MSESFYPYPVYFYEEGVQLPCQGTYYVIAENGVFLHKDRGVIKGLVPVNGVDFFDKVEEEDIKVVWTGPKIPLEVTYKIKRFFRRVVELFNSEACTILYYNSKTNEWKVNVPVQYVSRSSVNYQRSLADMGEFVPVGTIHSHADFGAFHSSTDVGDEESFDGIHLTFGNNNRDGISVSASVVMNGVREKIDPLSVLDGWAADGDAYSVAPAHKNFQEMDAEAEGWLQNVHKATFYYPYCVKSGIKRGDFVTWAKTDKLANDSLTSWQRSYGEGPFVVLGLHEDTSLGQVMEVDAGVQGKVSFPVEFFQKV